MSHKITAKKIYGEFKGRYPQFCKRGLMYELCDVMTILIRSPGVGKFTYTPTGHKITWLEYWVDPTHTKKMEKGVRPEYYTKFITKLKELMTNKGLSQESISLVTGISRQSINAYLNGRKIPKMSTMKDMAKKLGIDI